MLACIGTRIGIDFDATLYLISGRMTLNGPLRVLNAPNAVPVSLSLRILLPAVYENYLSPHSHRSACNPNIIMPSLQSLPTSILDYTMPRLIGNEQFIARQPLSPYLDQPARHTLSEFTFPCQFCGALHWLEEKTSASSHRNPLIYCLLSRRQSNSSWIST